jgi:hypothetical protein
MGDWLTDHGLATAAELETMRREEDKNLEETLAQVATEVD